MNKFFEPAREIPVRAEVDVLVVGAGPAGLMAAEAAAKGGKQKVMLLESRGFLGGNLILGLPILSMLDAEGKQIIKGATGRFVERLQQRGQATGHKRCKLHISLTMVDPEAVNKASLRFTLPHTQGSLSKILTVLSFYDINLTKIQSLPIIGREWEYQFYIDVTFDNYTRYRQSVEAVRPLTSDFTILGEYRECPNPEI